MNLLTAKKKLSECHLTSADTTDFFEAAGSKYLLQRAMEELKKLDAEFAGANKTQVEKRTRRIIQLMTMLRVKEDGTVQKESNSPRRTRSKNPLGTGAVPAGA